MSECFIKNLKVPNLTQYNKGKECFDKNFFSIRTVQDNMLDLSSATSAIYINDQLYIGDSNKNSLIS